VRQLEEVAATVAPAKRRKRSRGRRFAGVQRVAPAPAKGERAYPH